MYILMPAGYINDVYALLVILCANTKAGIFVSFCYYSSGRKRES